MTSTRMDVRGPLRSISEAFHSRSAHRPAVVRVERERPAPGPNRWPGESTREGPGRRPQAGFLVRRHAVLCPPTSGSTSARTSKPAHTAKHAQPPYRRGAQRDKPRYPACFRSVAKDFQLLRETTPHAVHGAFAPIATQQTTRRKGSGRRLPKQQSVRPVVVGRLLKKFPRSVAWRYFGFSEEVVAPLHAGRIRLRGPSFGL